MFCSDSRRGHKGLVHGMRLLDRCYGCKPPLVPKNKEGQAIMDHLRGLPVEKPGELPVIPVDARAAEVRAIRTG